MPVWTAMVPALTGATRRSVCLYVPQHYSIGNQKIQTELYVSASMQQERVKPDVVTYSGGKAPERALDVFVSMRQKRVQPNVSTYGT